MCDSVIAVVILTALSALNAAEIFVDAARPDDSGSGLNWLQAKKTMQAAIDISASGDVITVASGTYAPIATSNKAITIQSISGAETTIIDGGGTRSCAALGSAMNHTNTLLRGFTLQHGIALYPDYANYDPDYAKGGGSRYGTLSECILTQNIARSGGGTYGSWLYNCQVTDNHASYEGGGAFLGILFNSLITGNSAGSWGAGIYRSGLINCTVTKNDAYGYAVYQGSCINCIIWENKNSSGHLRNHNLTTFTYSCTSPKPTGTGNTDSDPQFFDADSGNYHLWFDSPCRNSGSNASAYEAFDIEGSPRIQEGIVNMGAYESIVEGINITVKTIGKGTVSPDYFRGLPGSNAAFTVQPGPRTFIHFLTNGVFASASTNFIWSNLQESGELTAVFEGLYVDASRPDNAGDGTSWITAKQSLQSAIDMTVDGETIQVTNGLYQPIITYNKTIKIQSVNGAEVTVIDGRKERRCATLCGQTESGTNTVLMGFTLQNGQTNYRYDNFGGGGARGGTLHNCAIIDNTSDRNGGGACYSTLINCSLSGNHAEWSYGGGAFGARLINCTVTENTGSYNGAGISSCTAINSIIWRNTIYNFAIMGNHSESTFVNSCTTPLPAGAGNIDSDPCFTDLFSRNYTLKSGSPCIDTGTSCITLPAADLRGHPRIQNGTVDMGAYELSHDSVVLEFKALGRGFISPSGQMTQSAGSSVTCTATNGTTAFLHFLTNNVIATTEPQLTLSSLTEDLTIEAVFTPVSIYVNSAQADNSGDGLTWSTAKRTIQAAISSAVPGDTIIVTNGVYAPITTDNMRIAVQSVNGAQHTVIDGGLSNRCATLGNSNLDRATLLAGFTLVNGKAPASTPLGGGVMHGTVNHCQIKVNLADYGACAYHSALNNCILHKSTGMFALEGGTAVNCTFYALSVIMRAKFRNCILVNCQTSGSFNFFESCCVFPFFDYYPGTGNIQSDPRLLDPENGDFRLRFVSPCLDTGDNAFVTTGTDFAGNSRIQGSQADMGALEGSMDLHLVTISVLGRGSVTPSGRILLAPGTNVQFSATATGIGFSHYLINGVTAGSSPEMLISNVHQDMSITAVFQPETLYVDAARPDDSGDGRSWDSAKRTIQAAVNAALYKDTICVTNGLYEPFVTANTSRYLTIKSMNGPSATQINGGGTKSCARLTQDTTLAGFTLTNGKASYGGHGGGAYNGIVTNCVLCNNSALYEGGGAYNCTLDHCTISNNAARSGGGAGSSRLNRCAISDNSAAEYGGGIYAGNLNNCLMTGNTARNGGGAASCIVNNCTLIDNIASVSGGGYFSNQSYNNTVNNSIVWMNRLTNGFPDNYSGGLFLHSCSFPLPAGSGNAAMNPQFFDPISGDYTLALSSPCINAGTNALTAGSSDLAGNSRINSAIVDMGAYEFNFNRSTISTPVAVPFAWLRLYPTIFKKWGTDYEGAATDDSDADGMRTWEEYIAGTVPTNALSTFKAVIAEKNGIAYLHWTPDLTDASPPRTYSIYGVTNLAQEFAAEPETNLPAGTPVPLQNLTPNRFFKVSVDVEQN